MAVSGHHPWLERHGPAESVSSRSNDPIVLPLPQCFVLSINPLAAVNSPSVARYCRQNVSAESRPSAEKTAVVKRAVVRLLAMVIGKRRGGAAAGATG